MRSKGRTLIDQRQTLTVSSSRYLKMMKRRHLKKKDSTNLKKSNPNFNNKFKTKPPTQNTLPTISTNKAT